MTKHSKYVGFFAASFFFCINSASFFDKMFEELEANIKEMRQSMQEVANTFDTANGSLSHSLAHEITTDTDNVMVTIKGFDIPADKINEQVTVAPSHNAVKVTVKSDNGYAVYAFTQNSLKMRAEYESRIMPAQSDNSIAENAEKKPVSISYNSSENFQSLPDTVDLSKIALEYNADENTLIIVLPKLHKKINVSVKQKPKAMEIEPK